MYQNGKYMKQVTAKIWLLDKKYHAESCDDDILLFSEDGGQNFILKGGVDEFRSEAIDEVAYNETEEGIEYNESDVHNYMTENMAEFISKCFSQLTKLMDEDEEYTQMAFV